MTHCTTTIFSHCPSYGRDYLASATEGISSLLHLRAGFCNRLLGTPAGISLIYSGLPARALRNFTLTRAIHQAFTFLSPVAATIKPPSFFNLAHWCTKTGTRWDPVSHTQIVGQIQMWIWIFVCCRICLFSECIQLRYRPAASRRGNRWCDDFVIVRWHFHNIGPSFYSCIISSKDQCVATSKTILLSGHQKSGISLNLH